MASTTADGNLPTQSAESEGMGTMTKLGIGAAVVGAGYLAVTGKGGSFLQSLGDIVTSKGAGDVVDIAQKAGVLSAFLGVDPKWMMAADGAQFVKDVVKNGIQTDNVGQLVGAIERWGATEIIESWGLPPAAALGIGQALKWGMESINQRIGKGAVDLMKNANIGSILHPKGKDDASPSAPSPVVAAAASSTGRGASNS